MFSNKFITININADVLLMYFDETYPLRSTFHAKQHANMLYLLPNKQILKGHNKNNRTTNCNGFRVTRNTPKSHQLILFCCSIANLK